MTQISKECAVLIKALNAELSAVKTQLVQLTQSLNFEVVYPPSHHDFQPSKTLKKFPILKPVSQSTTLEDPPLFPVPLCTDQPPIPLPRLASTHSKHTPRKAKKLEISVPANCDDTQHMLSVVDRREDEKVKARARYLILMREHIEKQLHQFTEKEKEIRKRKEKREKREKAARLQRKPSRFRSTGMDDRSYLENLYQSCLYKIIDVEHGLRKCGKLRSMSELKDFWEQMLAPLQTPMITVRPAASFRSELDEEFDVLKGEGCTNSWAITASTPDSKKQERSSVCPSTVPTPLRFTRCKLPDLKPIKEILDDNQEERVLSIISRSNEYQSPNFKLRMSVHQLYQRAKANEMAMRTLLPQGVEINRPAFIPSEPPSTLSSPIPHHSPILPPLSHVEDNCIMPNHMKDMKIRNPDLECKAVRVQGNNRLHPLSVKAAASKESKLASSAIKVPSKPVCVPLTMSEVLLTSPIKELKTKSMMWNNYQLAGK